MEQRTYQGTIDTVRLAQHLLDTYDRGDTQAQVLEDEQGIVVQIGKRSVGLFGSEPQHALTLALEPGDTGLRVTVGEQEWFKQSGRLVVGGLIGFFPFFFTWPLFGGRDEPVDPQLAQHVWQTVESYTAQFNVAPTSSQPLPRRPQPVTTETTRLPGIFCPSCGVQNPAGATRCQECGTYVGARDCQTCGVSNPATANFCMRCGSTLHAT